MILEKKQYVKTETVFRLLTINKYQFNIAYIIYYYYIVYAIKTSKGNSGC